MPEALINDAPRETNDTACGVVRIGATPLQAPLGVAPMAGMTDSAFRRLLR